MKTYTGERTLDGITVLVDGQPLDPRRDVKHLTDGDFEWAYEGTEPSQLALAILVDHFANPDEALRYVDPFMRAVIANFDNDWEVTTADIDEAIAALSQQRAAEVQGSAATD